MRVIDIYYRTAKGLEVPNEIKVGEYVFHYDITDDNEFYRYKTMTNDLITDIVYLNDEVEIIEEEHKIPEKLKCTAWGDKDENGNYIMSAFPTNEKLMNKINEIIDYLEENK